MQEHVYYKIVSIVGELEWEGTKKFYREMLYVFEKVVLPTYACCHVQFIMFYLVSFKMVSTRTEVLKIC